MDKPTRFEGRFLTALLKDTKGNTIAIAAAAMLPLLAMVGGAVDASRFYMTQTRLQAACDAGALAARQAMVDDTFDDVHRDKANDFFDENYKAGTFGLENLSRTYSSDGSGQVDGRATGRLPTSIMGAFGYQQFDIAVDCTADINISNTDIMFVLDTTGSMGGGIAGGGTRIQGLRQAVMAFYDTVEGSTSPNAQVRYGAVPYSMNVNVGGVLAATNATWLANNATFQSRWAKYDRWTITEVNVLDIDANGEEVYIGEVDEITFVENASQCNALKPEDFEDRIISELGTHQGVNSDTRNGNERTRTFDDDNEQIWRGEGFSSFNSSNGQCRWGWDVYEDRGDVEFEVVDVRDPAGDVGFDEYIYTRVNTANPPDTGNPTGSPAGWSTINLRDVYGTNRQIDVPIGEEGAMTTLTWDGCIEEAQTVTASNFDPIPAGAFDLNINLVPATEAQRWRPVIRNIAWERRRNSSNNSRVTRNVGSTEWANQQRPGYTCPRPAFRLADMTRDNLQTFVNSLQPSGNTYHDIGMIWGARFISPRGIFATDNVSTPNGDEIARHIVFMTDGELAPTRESQTTYGIEWWDRRITGNANSNRQRNRHAARFQAACRAARQENISVWVVAFGTTLTQNLIDCATPGRAFAASSTAELTARFEEIAQRIAALRLTN